MGKQLNIRAESALVIARTLSGEPFDGATLPARLEDATARDIALYRELCFGTLREFIFLEALFSGYLKKPIANKEPKVKALLAIGCYQLLYTRVPDHAAISTTVDGCKRLGKDWARGLTNAVLRNVARDLAATTSGEMLGEQSIKTLIQRKKLASEKASSLPAWLYHKLQQSWPMELEQLIDHSRSAPVMALRVAADERENYLSELASTGLDATASRISDRAILLDRGVSVEKLPGFFAGEASVQDAGAQLAAVLLETADGDRVLDACSAPGGKTLGILQRAKSSNKTIDMTALDVSAQRLTKVRENLERADEHAKVIAADACDVAAWWDGVPFDKILIDAPCSGTGVMNRHPDIKLHRRQGDITGFASQQSSLLSKLWPCLAIGGELLYCTCSILPEENSAVVDYFLQKHADAISIDIEAGWGRAVKFGRQLLPNKAENDGFFFAKIKKVTAA